MYSCNYMQGQLMVNRKSASADNEKHGADTFQLVQRRIIRHIPQILLRVTIEDQISISNRVIVDQIIQF